MSERFVRLKPSDTYKEITEFEDGVWTEFLLKVQDVNTDHTGQDYLWALYALDELNVSASTTIDLRKDQRQGKVAILPAEIQLSGRKVKIEKIINPPKGTKWSYNFSK